MPNPHCFHTVTPVYISKLCCGLCGSKGFPAIKGIVIASRFQDAELYHMLFQYNLTRNNIERSDSLETRDSDIIDIHKHFPPVYYL